MSPAVHAVARQLLVASIVTLLPAVTAAQTGAIGGTVRAAGSSSPLENVQVHAVDTGGILVRSANTNAAGVYLIQLLPPGTYFLFTSSGLPYVDEIYNDIPCVGLCQASSAANKGAGTVVTAGATAPGRDFSLAPEAAIAGTVTRAGTSTGISGVVVYAITASGLFAGDTATDAGGLYQIGKLAAGTYYLFSQNDAGYLDRIYDNIACAGICTAAAASQLGTPVTATAGAVTGGQNFALPLGGRIAGVVTSATGVPIPGVTVLAFSSTSSGSATSGPTGAYEIAGLAAGTHVVQTVDADIAGAGFRNEIYDNLPCPVRCSTDTARATGAPVAVSLAATTPGINFALAPGGRVTGTVTDAVSGAPVPGVVVFLVSSTPAAVSVAPEAATNAAGAFSVTGLPPGTYYAFTFNQAGYINEIYNDISCAGPCFEMHALIGAPIAVAPGGTTPGVNFALSPGGRVSGAVVDAATMAGVPAMAVVVYDALGREMSRGSTNASGVYLTGAGIPGGTYYLVTTGNGGYIPELFDNLPCPGSCAGLIPTGTPVVVTAGATTTGRNFTVERGGRIRGTVTRDGTAQPIANVSVSILDSAGRFVTSDATDLDGIYTSDIGLSGGTYFAATFNFFGYVNELFDNKPCVGNCFTQATTGTPIAVTTGVTSFGVDFALAPHTGPPGAPDALRSSHQPGGVLISWFEGFGTRPTSYRLEAGFAPGTTALAIPVTGTSFLAAGVPPGQYYVRVYAVNAAGASPPSAEIVVNVGAGGVVSPGVPRGLFFTMAGSRLILVWSEPNDGGAPLDYIVEAGASSGAANIAILTVDRMAFTYDPVPAGFYFLRVRARNAAGVSAPSNEVMLVVGGVPSPSPAPVRFAATVAGSTVTLAWLAPAGPVTGYIVEAGSAPGLSNLATVPLGPATTASFSGVPSGRYYVRLRAVNALGRGIVSNEIIVIVP